MQTISKRLAFILSASVAVAAFSGGLVNCSDDPPPPATPVADAMADAPTVPGPSDASADSAADSSTPTGLPRGAIDRVGRPLAILMSIDPGERDSWNKEDSFEPTEGTYENQIQNNLIAFDTLDSTREWDAQAAPADASAPPDGGSYLTHQLGKMMFRDFLVVDASKAFSPTGYLDVEREVYLGGAAHATCGGRWLADDAIDKQLSLVIKGQLTGVSDGVSAATKPPTMTFPYLATPN